VIVTYVIPGSVSFTGIKYTVADGHQSPDRGVYNGAGILIICRSG
jgi:hypothetical protein